MSLKNVTRLLALELCLLAPCLEAQVTVYTNRQAWQTAAASLQVTTIGFEGIAPVGGTKSYSTAAGLTLNGVNFVGRSSGGFGLSVADAQFYNANLYNRGTGASLQASNSCCSLLLNQFNVTLPAGVYAAGADLWTVPLDGLAGNGTDVVNMSVNGSPAGSTRTLPNPTLAFLGFISSTPVTTLDFFQSTSGEIPELDNFSFGVRAETPPPPVIAAVVSATGIPGSVQPNIESGSWVAIYGTNLSSVSTDWSGQINGGKLPVKVGGVSVTIGGVPASVYYVSPSQLNVQAPDATAGAVPVVVTNNGVASAPVMAQLQTFAPAFFQWGPTKYAVMTRYPDNAYLSGPSAGAPFVSAKPGDIAILWATGFGPTNPTQAAGVIVSGAPQPSSPVVLTVDGILTPLIGAALSPGLAGVYQISFQIPASVRAGDVLVKASVGGAFTPDNVYLYIVRN